MNIKGILTPLLIILLLFSIVVMGAPNYGNIGPTTEFNFDIKIEDEIVAEGSTADEFETTFSITDPTADRTFTFPDSNQTYDLSLYYLKTAIDTQGEMETIWGVSLELETHASEHTVGGADTIFPADPNADRYLMWDDAPTGELIWTEISGGYTNLTSFVDQTAWRLFYSDSLGDVIELALGVDGTYLKSTGAASAPIFSTPAGAGDMLVATYDVDVDGDIDVAAGGTEKSSWTLYTIPYLSGTTTFGEITIGTVGQVLKVGAGATGYEFGNDTNVTVKTTTATLTVAEQGTILVSASSAYTITLPTAAGNAGLTYHFIKTDANYNLITLDGDGTETINYENATSAPCLTYVRLNTYCAEVTLVSDNANWQVINEVLGQVPACSSYITDAVQENVTSGVVQVDVSSEEYDIGGNFDNTSYTGSATATSASHLVDTTNNQFLATMVGKYITNTTDSTYTYCTAYNSVSDITVRDNIFVNGEGYEINESKFTAPVTGKYLIEGMILFGDTTVVADKRYLLYIRKNQTSNHMNSNLQSSSTMSLTNTMTSILALTKDDYIELGTYNNSGVNTVDLAGGLGNTSMTVRLLSKD